MPPDPASPTARAVAITARHWPLLAVLAAYFHVFMEWLCADMRCVFVSSFGTPSEWVGHQHRAEDGRHCNVFV